MAYIQDVEIIGQPIEQPLTPEQFNALDRHQLWTLFQEQQARIEYFEAEDRRKAEKIYLLWKAIDRYREALKKQ